MRVVGLGILPVASLAAALLAPAPAAAQTCLDTDADGICNFEDNCKAVSNRTQADTDLDGFGNRCDGDFNNDGVVDGIDAVQYLQPSVGRADPDPAYNVHVDVDENGSIGDRDVRYFLDQFQSTGRPGPSGLTCAGHPPCVLAIPPPSTKEHVLNRITYGATPELRARIQQLGVHAFVREQLDPSQIADPELDARLASLSSLSMSVPQLLASFNDTTIPLQELARARVLRMLTSRRQLEELLVDFWYDHFNVFSHGGYLPLTVPVHERDAIRPFVLGRFADMLQATARSPAMIEYLDNHLNTNDGLNENYSRELLELHTMGVDSGYTQGDILEVARTLTGWGFDLTLLYGFRYRPWRHDNGARSLLQGLEIPAGSGAQGGVALLDYLARRPETARFLCRKLVMRFVADDPPEWLVASAARTFLETDGDLRAVMQQILTAPDFFAEQHRRSKVKRPAVLIASLARTLDADPDAVAASVQWQIETLGEAAYLAPFPTGYPDRSDYWASPGNFVTALNHIQNAARGLKGYDPVFRVPAQANSFQIADSLILQLLPDGVSSGTRSGAVALAHELRHRPHDERVRHVAAFLLSSPEFLLH